MISNPTAINTHTQLASCRAASRPSDVASSYSYYNGPYNNGVKATLTLNTINFLIDGVTILAGDRVLLNYTSAPDNLVNGIYLCIQDVTTVPGATSSILQRADDLQSSAQLLAGAYLFISEGSFNQGSYAMLKSPFPSVLGLSGAISFLVFQDLLTPTVREATMTGDNILASTDATYQFLNPGAANRSVLLPTPTTGMVFVIKNTSASTFNVTVKDDTSVTIGVPLSPGLSSVYMWSGTVWQTL